MNKILLILLFLIGINVAAEPVELIVPYAPAGSVDTVGRIVAEGFRQQGLDIVVINKPGGLGVVGTRYVMNSPANGKTMLLTSTTFLFNHLQKIPGANYDLENGLSHVGLIGTTLNVIYSRKTLQFDNFGVVVKQMQNGADYTWGTTNLGAEFTARLIASKARVDIRIIRYAGSQQAITDLMGGHIDFVIDSRASHIASSSAEANKINLVATTDGADKYLPGVLTQSWYGISLPPGADPKLVAHYNFLLNRVLQDTKIKTQLENNHLSVDPKTTKNFVDLIEDEFKFYSPIASKIVNDEK
jgi:tripartite-type tricarboxylate transporter receptor subunit TctC